MVPMGTNTDEWIADVASYVAQQLRQRGAVRDARARRRGAQGEPAHVDVVVRRARLDDADAARSTRRSGRRRPATTRRRPRTASTARARRDGRAAVAQEPGMWFQIELPQPVNVAEILVDTLAGGRGGFGFGFGRGRGGAPGRSALVPTACRCRWTARRGASRSPKARARTRRPPSRSSRCRPGSCASRRPARRRRPRGWAIQRVRIFTRRSARVEAMIAMALQSINPATGETLATFDTLAPAEVDGPGSQRAVAAFRSLEAHAVRRARAAPDARRRHPRKRIRSSSGG